MRWGSAFAAGRIIATSPPPRTLNMELLVDQPSLPGLCPVTEAVDRLAHAAHGDEHGAVFTRREVVEFMLDLAGYLPERDLTALRLLEPSSGGGEFLVAAVERLIASWRQRGGTADLSACVHAIELHRDTFEATRQLIQEKLTKLGLAPTEAQRLVCCWLHRGDFLLAALPGVFDVVVGNPPYVRQELIPAPLLAEYRRRFATLYDRADLYVPFIERSLDALSAGGQMVFICADRWIKNKYGGPLRAKVAAGFHLRAYVDMVDTPAFEAEVSAYPAITLITREASGPTLVAERPELDAPQLSLLAKALRADGSACPGVRVLPHAVHGDQPWLLSTGDMLAIIRRFEATLPTLEEAGCKVGIGVATGADKVYIGPWEQLDVEPSRKLPLATTKDIASGQVVWKGQGVLNPFESSGELVDLAAYPKLATYLARNREAIMRRHVAQKSPDRWYRTIDRIWPELTQTPKLLIPDIKGQAQVVFDEGSLYPHHNLYYVVSQTWPLRALQAVLLSTLAKGFIRAYSTTMRGGFLRFQAQYLRRIRLPHWADVPESVGQALTEAAEQLDVGACDRAVAELYGLTDAELAILQG
jgi:TaqI-like C-terminal specificity domain/Eco57I restriction-modification methylase